MRKNLIFTAFSLVAASMAFSACNGSGDAAPTGGSVATTPNPLPTAGTGGGGGDNPAPSKPGVIGDSCETGADGHICLGLKYVVYKDGSGNPVVSQNDAINNVKQINQTWSQCNLGFQIENYSAVDPKDYGLTFNTADMSELNSIRQDFNDGNTLLVVTTGSWAMGGSANAWTNLPGEGIYGAILESPVGTFALIIAHELGHYLSLDHVSDASDLMSPLIYDTSTALTSSQCNQARSSANQDWQSMQR